MQLGACGPSQPPAFSDGSVPGSSFVSMQRDAQIKPSALGFIADGRMLVGTTDRGLYVVGPDGQIENFRLSDGLPSNEITSIAVETDGERRAFIATSAGISQYVALRGQLQRAVCGDGIVDVSEECDDGGVRTERCYSDRRAAPWAR